MSDPQNCPACGATLATPLLCEACGRLLEANPAPSPFQALGLPLAFALDGERARKRLLALSRALHPDFHSTADARTLQLAQDNTAALNAAFHTVSDSVRRAHWLVGELGGPGEEQERALPTAFLQEVLEWSETVDEARSAEPGSAARQALEPLAKELEDSRRSLMGEVEGLLTPLPAPAAPQLAETRRRLNALRYIDRVLREIGELRIAATA